MKITTQQLGIWPKHVKVVSDIPLKISHEEVALKLIWQVVHVEVAPHHGEKAPVSVLCLVG